MKKQHRLPKTLPPQLEEAYLILWDQEDRARADDDNMRREGYYMARWYYRKSERLVGLARLQKISRRIANEIEERENRPDQAPRMLIGLRHALILIDRILEEEGETDGR